MADNVERLGAIIDVQYNGQDNIARFIADLERLGLIQGRMAGDFNRIWASAQAGTLGYRDAVLQLDAALGSTATHNSDMGRLFDTIVSGGRDAERQIKSVTTALQGLERIRQQLIGGSGGGGGLSGALASQIRDTLSSAVAARLGNQQRAALPPALFGQGSDPNAQRQLTQNTRELERNTTAQSQLTRAIEAATRQGGRDQTPSAPLATTAIPGSSLPLLESRETIAARQQELASMRAIEQSMLRRERFEERVANIAMQRGGPSALTYDRQGNLGIASGSESSALLRSRDLTTQIGALTNQMREVLRTSRTIPVATQRYEVQQSNIGRIIGALQAARGDRAGDLTQGLGNSDALAGVAGLIDAPRVTSKDRGLYNLLTNGRLDREMANRIGPEGVNALGLDPQMFGRASSIQVPGFLGQDMVKAGALLPSTEAHLAQLEAAKAQLLDELTTVARALPLGNSDAMARARDQLANATFYPKPGEVPGNGLSYNLLSGSTNPDGSPKTDLDPNHRRLVAFPTGDPMSFRGSLEWAKKAVEIDGLLAQRAGEIAQITTHPRFYKQGIGSSLFREAQRLSAEQGFAPPVHSDVLTNDGRAFRAAMERRALTSYQYRPVEQAPSQLQAFLSGSTGGVNFNALPGTASRQAALRAQQQADLAAQIASRGGASNPIQALIQGQGQAAPQTEQMAQATRKVTVDLEALARATEELRIAEERVAALQSRNPRQEAIDQFVSRGATPAQAAALAANLSTTADRPTIDSAQDALAIARTRLLSLGAGPTTPVTPAQTQAQAVVQRLSSALLGQRAIAGGGLPPGNVGGTVGYNVPPPFGGPHVVQGTVLGSRIIGGGGSGSGGSGGGGGSSFGGPFPLSGPGGGFFDQFGAGFRPSKGYAFGLGQTARFSLFYGAMYKTLFAITQTFDAALNEAIEFESAVTELKIATGRSADEVAPLAGELGQVAARAGFSPAEGVLAGSRAIGLYGLNDASLQQQSTAAIASAQTTAMLGLGNPNRSFQDIQSDLAATSNAFGFGYQGQSYLADLDAYFSRKFGIAPGSTLQPVAETAALGQAAGFTLEQQAAISADLQSRTGQSASTIGGLLSQIFTRTGEGALQTTAARYGVDPNASLRDQMKALARVYERVGQRERIDIAASFGRGRSQGAAAILLEDFDRILGKAEDAKKEAPGSADKQFQERLNNIGGIIATLSGSFKEFALLFGSTGLIEGLGALLIAANGLLDGFNGILSVFDQLNGTVRLVTLGLLAMYAASKIGLTSNILTSAATGTRGGLFNRLAPGFAPVQQVQYDAAGKALPGSLAFVGPNGELAKGAGLFRASAAAGAAALTSLVNPVTIAIGGLVAMGSIISSAQRFRAAADQAQGLILDFAKENPNPNDITPDALRGYQSSLTTQAETLRGSTSGLANFVTFGQLNNQPTAMADSLDRSAKFAGRLADEIEKAAGDAPDLSSLQLLDADSIQQAFTGISTQGGNATDQMNFLANAIFHVGKVAEAAGNKFDPKTTAGTAATTSRGNILRGLGRLGPLQDAEDGVGFTGQRIQRFLPNQDLLDSFTTNVTEGNISSVLQDVFQSRGIKKDADLGKKNANLVAGDAATAIAGRIEGFDELIPEAQQQIIDVIRKKIRDSLLAGSHNARKALNRDVLSAAEGKAAADSFVTGLDQQLNLLPETAYGARSSTIGRTLNRLRRIQDKVKGPDVSTITDQINALQIQFAEQKIAEFDAFRKAQQHDAKSKAEIRAIGQRFLRRSINAAIQGGDTDGLVNLLSSAGGYAVDVARDRIRDMIRVIQVLNEIGDALNSAIDIGLSVGFQGLDINSKGTGKNPYEKRLRAMLRALPGVTGVQNADDPFLHGNDANLKDSVTADTTDTAAQIAAARQTAIAAGSRNDIAQAAAAVQSARADLAAAKPGTVAYWQAFGALQSAQVAYADTVRSARSASIEASAARAGGQLAGARAGLQTASIELQAQAPGTAAYFQALGQFYQAQIALQDVMRQYQHVLNSLAIDTTNPLQVANLALREARRKLAQDLGSGRGEDVIAQDRLDVQTAQNEAESTRFSQRLEAAQTADQLGRISHGAYLRYLDNEKDRLESIKNRTFQQQQELNQIDGLLQDAANSMSSQFNLGDIKLPTPYEVRRFIERSSHGAVAAASAASGAQSSTSVTTINVDGTDVAMVRQIIREVTGTEVPRRTGTVRRKTTVR